MSIHREYMLEALTLPLPAIPGSGILVSDKVMWCGERLRENYTIACQRFTSDIERTLTEQQVDSTVLATALKVLIEQYVFSIFKKRPHFSQETDLLQVEESADADMQALITRTYELLNSVPLAKSILAQHERIGAQRELQEQIIASRGLVPDTDIEQAEQALEQDTSEIQRVAIHLHELRNQAVERVDDVQVYQESIVQHTKYLSLVVQHELTILWRIISLQSSVIQQRFNNAVQGILALNRQAWQLTQNTPAAMEAASALETALHAYELLQGLLYQCSIVLAQQQQERYRRLAEAVSKLHTLQHIALDIEHVVNNSAQQELIQEIEQARAMLYQSVALVSLQRFEYLREHADTLSEQVLRTIYSFQQSRAVVLAATTLGAMGYHDVTRQGANPTARVSGNTIHLSVKRGSRSVTLALSLDGSVTYDAHGDDREESEGVGQENAMLRAMRERGVFLVSRDSS